MYEVKVLADSVSPGGKRLLTIAATFPRFILAEVNTHCRMSRNSASSRAIPPEIQIAKVRDKPFVPEVFRARVKGMGQGEVLEDQDKAREIWLDGAYLAAQVAEDLSGLGINKSHVNRVLEPYLWHTAIITATEWENFNALRIPPGDEVDYDFPAQPEFQQFGILARKAARESESQRLQYGQWHTPLADEASGRERCMISAGRCARVSYEKLDWEPPKASIARAERLLESGHMSPFMHQGTPYSVTEYSPWKMANFEGWAQFRKLLKNEHNSIGIQEQREAFDPRFPYVEYEDAD